MDRCGIIEPRARRNYVHSALYTSRYFSTHRMARGERRIIPYRSFTIPFLRDISISDNGTFDRGEVKIASYYREMPSLCVLVLSTSLVPAHSHSSRPSPFLSLLHSSMPYLRLRARTTTPDTHIHINEFQDINLPTSAPHSAAVGRARALLGVSIYSTILPAILRTPSCVSHRVIKSSMPRDKYRSPLPTYPLSFVSR